MTFEELQALIDRKDIDVGILPELDLNEASYFGRIFARTGGVTEAIKEAVKEHGYEDMKFEPAVCDGIDKCKTALLKAGRGIFTSNFIEGMACIDGCIGGAACLKHGDSNKAGIDRFGSEAEKTEILQAAEPYLGD